MPAWTKEQARERLDMWLKAEEGVSTSQEYRIGTRTLRRADLKEIREQILFWKRQLDQLEGGRGGGARVMRLVPRDT